MKRWLINLSLVLLFPSGIFLLDGCYPNDTLSVDQTDIMFTGYYDSVNFQSLSTYFMPDTVFVIRDDTTDKTPLADQDLILNTITKNMSAYGYQRIIDLDTANPPDVELTATAIITTNVQVGWWYPYYPGWGWGWWYWKKSADAGHKSADYYWDCYYCYPGYYPPGWGWGYPYYTSYTTGTLILHMANPLDYRIIDNDGDGQANDTVVPVYWAGAAQGVVGSGSNTSRITNAIDQIYKQSPEIKTN